MKYSTRLGENCDDLQKALELMLGIPHRATDNKFISNIEGYKGNIHKLGRLLTHVGTFAIKYCKIRELKISEKKFFYYFVFLNIFLIIPFIIKICKYR